MKTKQLTNRQVGLLKIESAGYHGKSPKLIAIEYKISASIMWEHFDLGKRQKASGVKCNCNDCQKERKP